MNLQHIYQQNYYDSCEKVDKAECFGCARQDVKNKDNQKREVKSLEFLVLLRYLYRGWVIIIHLGCLHFNDLLIKLCLTVFFSFWFLFLFLFRRRFFISLALRFPLFFILFTTLFLIIFDRINPVFADINNRDDEEDGKGKEGKKDGAPLTVLSERVTHLNKLVRCKYYDFKLNLNHSNL